MDINITLAYLGVIAAVVLSGIGSSIAVSTVGCTVVGSMKKNPSALGTYITLCALPSSQGIYGLVGFFIAKSYLLPGIPMFSAISIMATGMILGLVCLFSAIRQAKVCANGVAAIGDGHNVFGATMVLAVFAELYPILALLVMILMVLGVLPNIK